VIDDLLACAIGGVGGALVVRGEAGIGKSALLEYAAENAGEMVVLTATGVEAEADLAFGGVFGLVRPIVDKLDELPEVQGAALLGALGLGPSTGADRLLVSAALLGLLAAAAEDRPLLCVVDDAQWLDRPSADALVFVARRLRAEQLAMLFGAREGEAQRFEAVGLQELQVQALNVESARILVSGRIGEAPTAVHERVVAEAAGNPLALLELPQALSEEQLTGSAPVPEAIPLTPRLRDVFRKRIERLPEAAQTALLVVAAEDTGDLKTIILATAQADVPVAALDAASQSGLVRLSEATIALRHPLVRAALWAGASLTQRQRAHTALAEVLTGEEHTDRRVWHQAMATLTADEEVAAALEASARRSEVRAAHASAATAFLRAAELSVEEGRRVRRLTAAASAAWHAGQPDRAREAIALALPVAEGQLRVRLLRLSGGIEVRCGSLATALDQLLEASDTSSDPSLTVELLADAAEAAIFSGHIAKAAELCARAGVVEATTSRDRMMVSVLLGFGKVLAGDHKAAQALLAEVVREADALGEPSGLIRAASSATVAGTPGDGLALINRAVDTARRQGLVSLLPTALQTQGYELFQNGQLELAYAAAEEGYRLAIDVGHGHGWHLTTMAMVEAVRGQDADARRHSEEVLAIGHAGGSTFLSGVGEWTLGFLDLVMGRPEEATGRLLAASDVDRQEVNPLVALPAIPDAIEAAVRSGRSDQVGPRLAVLETWAETARVDARLAWLARCQALLGVRSPDDAFGEAIALAATSPPLDRARTELLYGEWLRRERRRQEARGHLRVAIGLFQSLGAVPFSKRAEAELRATGETARKRDPSTLDDLTPQELQIAGLVAEGLTNKEIAAQLYLSPRTVDYHLRKVFSKLGIASRTELVRDGLPAR
jgi:DNA-binding CsgD family transcriptional regulator